MKEHVGLCDFKSNLSKSYKTERLLEDETLFNKTLNTLNDNFKKGLITEELCVKAAVQLDEIMKARNVKYYKREGSPSNYKYYYTEEQYKKEKGGKKEEGGGNKSQEEKDLEGDKK